MWVGQAGRERGRGGCGTRYARRVRGTKLGSSRRLLERRLAAGTIERRPVRRLEALNLILCRRSGAVLGAIRQTQT